MGLFLARSHRELRFLQRIARVVSANGLRANILVSEVCVMDIGLSEFFEYLAFRKWSLAEHLLKALPEPKECESH